MSPSFAPESNVNDGRNSPVPTAACRVRERSLKTPQGKNRNKSRTSRTRRTRIRRRVLYLVLSSRASNWTKNYALARKFPCEILVAVLVAACASWSFAFCIAFYPSKLPTTLVLLRIRCSLGRPSEALQIAPTRAIVLPCSRNLTSQRQSLALEGVNGCFFEPLAALSNSSIVLISNKLFRASHLVGCCWTA